MSYLIVKNAAGEIVGWGPANDGYEPTVPPGGSTEEAATPPQPALHERRAGRVARLVAQIQQIEGSAHRALRDLVLSQPGNPARPRMQAIESAVAPLRARIATINAAATDAALDAIA